MNSAKIVSIKEQTRLATFKAELKDEIFFSANEEGFDRFFSRVRRLLDNQEREESRRKLQESEE
ncbi:MAG TPA: hypothetical protein PLK76_01215 [bacterium]|nr:hypothetical protein [bacterium]